MSPLISVVTPTYQRAGTLPRLFESLVEQDFGDFNWIVVDDGSADETPALIEAWNREATFEIRYRAQANQGKHVAVNRGVKEADGTFCALMDSDDWYAPGALAAMVACWNDIPESRREGFANVEGLCAGPDGELLGDRFPADVCDSNTFEMTVMHAVGGDTVGMYRRDVLAAHPFPEDLGWHVMPALVWNRIAARWSTRFVNEIWGYKEYMEGGLTVRRDELRLLHPEPRFLFWKEVVEMPRPMPRKVRLRANANYLRYGLLSGESLSRLLDGVGDRRWALTALPIATAYFIRDRARRAAAVEAGP